MEKNYKEILPQITTFIFDVDGVLTNGKVQLLPDGEMVRTMSVRDGFAIKSALEQGYNVAIISGGTSESVRKRLNFLGVEDVYLRISHKLQKFESYCEQKQITPDEVLYMGDDLPDLDVLRAVALGCAPQDADSEVLNVANYVSHKKGGEGAARDIIEQVMRVQGKWQVEGNASKFG
ncbi:MAG: 3-deoxy-D-manno-octulosonate 8-phosphate phosphatase [Flavobacteriales bacterium]|nr:MAG: 3-deoxy-D-manno-octulosonate 8-phosphate phosphatase [Flavobacteriales bacterium]